jgi:hypothetical protein
MIFHERVVVRSSAQTIRFGRANSGSAPRRPPCGAATASEGPLARSPARRSS